MASITTLSMLNQGRKFLVSYRRKRAVYNQKKNTFKNRKKKFKSVKKAFKSEKKEYKAQKKHLKSKLQDIRKAEKTTDKKIENIRKAKKTVIKKRLNQQKKLQKGSKVKIGQYIGSVTTKKHCFDDWDIGADKTYLHIEVAIEYGRFLFWGNDWSEVNPLYLMYRNENEAEIG